MKSIQYILKRVKNDKFALYMVCIGAVMIAILDIPLPLLNGKSIDLLSSKSINYINFFRYQAIILALYSLKTFISYYIKKTFGYIGNRVIRELKLEMIDHSFNLPLSYIDNTNKGYIHSRINEADNIRPFFSANSISIIIGVLEWTVSLIAIFTIDIRLAAISLLCMLFLIYITKVNTNKMTEINKVLSEKFAFLSKASIQSIELIKQIKILSIYENEKNKLGLQYNDYLSIQDNHIKYSARYTEITQFLSAVHNILILLFAGVLIYYDNFTIGTYITYLGFSSKVFGNALMFSGFNIIMNPVCVSISRINDFLSIPEERFGDYILNDDISSIKFDNLHFAYKDKDILRDFTCEIHTNDFVLVCGKNGIGKTTILSILLGLYSSANGSITINNKKLAEYDISSIRKHVSYMSQDGGLFEGSLLSNLFVSYSKQFILERLKEKKLDDLLTIFNNDLEYYISANGTNLSGGQKQVVLFLRTVLNMQSLMIFDEPTNALDNNSRLIIIEYLKSLSGNNQIVIIVSHDLVLINQFSFTKKIELR